MGDMVKKAVAAFERDGHLPSMTVSELDQLCAEAIELIQADIDAFDERFSVQAEARDDGKTTAQHAIDALQRPERFNGEHDIARAWLRQEMSHLGIFTRERL